MSSFKTEIMNELKNMFKTWYILVLSLIVIIFLFSIKRNNKIKSVEKKVKVVSISYNENVSNIYPGRHYVAKSEYNELGLPNDREWLTRKEWRGKHVKKDTAFVFKKWKKRHIQQFVNWISISAVKETAVYKDIPASIIAAQAILESNYGLSRVACEANNIFGHKFYGKDSMFIIAADDSPTDKFQVYKSKWWNIRYHSKHLLRKYRKRIVGKPNLNKWLVAICGATTVKESKKFVEKGNYVYATSCYTGKECYSEKLQRIINLYNLQKLD